MTDILQKKIEQVDQITPENYYPGWIIDAANALIQTGKEHAIEAIRMFIASQKNSIDNFGLFLLLRVIFLLPATMKYPEINIGKFDYDEPTGNEERTFPVMMIDKVPFLMVTGYFSGGLPQPVEEHLLFYEQNGDLRKELFVPDYSAGELAAKAQQHWESLYNTPVPARLRNNIIQQAGRAVI